MYVSSARRVSFNKNLGDALEGCKILWHKGLGRCAFSIILNNEANEDLGWVVTGRQVSAAPVKSFLGIVPGTRVWFEYDPDAMLFMEVRREYVTGL